MNHPLPSITYPVLKQLLLSRLQAALDFYVSNGSVLKKQWDQHIPLHRAKDDSRVLYVSGIALQLSQGKNIPALEIATTIANLVCRAGLNSGASGSHDFTVQVIPPGWIHLELTQPTLAAWLQSLAQVPPWLGKYPPTTPPPLSDTSRLFAIQYAHARCCSLVQLAHREGLIMLSQPEPDTSPPFWHVLAPDPIPWLNSDQKLRFCHPTERVLIAQLLGLLDDLYCPCRSRKTFDWEKAALDLSQAFQSFYSCCRIWGEVKIQTISLAQARLGLVMATQPVLRLLLQDLFGVSAPLEL